MGRIRKYNFKLLPSNLTDNEYQNIEKLLLNSNEYIVMVWNVSGLLYRPCMFMVTNEKIFYGNLANPNVLDLSDINHVKFDKVFCLNFDQKSRPGKNVSIPAIFFFENAKYGKLDCSQKRLLEYIEKKINDMLA